MKQELTGGVGLTRHFAIAGIGGLIAIAVYAFAAFVSNDLRLIYAVGAILLFCTARWLGAKSKKDWRTVALLCGPLVGMFSYLVLPKSPALWPDIFLWIIAATIGMRLATAGHWRNSLMICGVGVLLAASVWYCMRYIPEHRRHSLTKFKNSSAPKFALRSLSGETNLVTPRAGTVLVMDFFATSCAPCIAELPVIAAVRDDLKEKPDIEFVLVASDVGGDTPEHFRSFAEKRGLTLPLAYDEGGNAHASFGLTGVPALVVLDRMGRVRLTREGYDATEVDFRRDLVQFLKTL